MTKKQARNENEAKGGLAEAARKRIAQLEAERDAFVTQANQRIAAYNGAIAELSLLINPPAGRSETPREG
jgi:hypothetical protein